MKLRDSGMPAEAYWETLFDVPLVLSRLRIAEFHDVAELGCGYGTFSIPVAQAISGTLYTFDVDPAMIDRTRDRAAHLPAGKLVCAQRDVMESGFGVEVDAVLLFNILHCDEPVGLLELACDAVRPGGCVLAIHWRYDQTPRGPSLEIRPRPVQIAEWARATGRLVAEGGPIDLPPWHYGWRLRAQNASSE
jgi:SAM-dependent methyltransferase